MGHHQNPENLHAKILGKLDVLFGDVGLGAVNGDAGNLRPRFGRHVQIFDPADARDE
ncbi:hypothetical protein SDC9_202955 [bioreactor metagenome]|uniref:Uncharacterized protein n=1 Tax=bioreactor metagenome TaxID=1076179 RepID=A0A645J448_9ZZZZ